MWHAMTIINNSFGFIFVHIPKCGGTSVSMALSCLTQFNDVEIGGTPLGQTIEKAYRTRFGIGKHSTAIEIRNVVGQSLWARYYTFGVVRNPYRRAISAYTFLKTHEKDYPAMMKFSDFNAWIQSEEWNGSGPDGLNLPQRRWLTDASRGRLVDQVFRLEDIITDIEPLVRWLGVSEYQKTKIKLRKDNPSHIRVALNTIEDRTIDLIRTRYEEDFALFGYPRNFQSPSLPQPPSGQTLTEESRHEPDTAPGREEHRHV
jgi:hypothetical protein